MTSNIIILDRDGVINYDSDDYIKNTEEWIPLPGSIEAISELSRAGFRICIATNQSGLGRGLFTEYDLANMHELMRLVVEEQGGKIDGIFFCPHTPEENCACRKPGIELLNQIEEHFSQSVENAWFIGDTEKDIDAALAKNCKPILVLTGKGSLTQATINPDKLYNIPVFDDLFTASMFVISELNGTP
jgi:D-glycero-D-manno-heptose 1,7-bisphosphate phosphatase